MRRAEWATIPNLLFTCDITKPFKLKTDTDLMKFDVITAWEVMEHIATPDLHQLSKNVSQHLKPQGLWIMSVSPHDDIVNGVSLHQTVESESWWIEKMASFGFHHHQSYVDYFNTQYVRDPKFGAPNSFHLVLSESKNLPTPPHLNLKEKFLDEWIGSRYQRMLNRLIIGN